MAETEFLAASTTPISACNAYVQLWVDQNANPQGDNPVGVYVVDDKTNLGSRNEGTESLQTACTKGNYIGFSAFNIDPNADADVSIASVGTSQAWGFTGTPQSDGQGNFVGQVQNSGVFGYSVSLNVGEGGGQTIHLTDLALNVLGS